MNPITCGMAADLLPLYLDGCCSADSRAALEAHMDACPACRAQYAQLRRDLTPAAPAAEDPGTDGIARALARKMRRRKRCLRALCAVLGVLLAVLLVFIGKTFVILGQPGGAVSAALPAGATDLVAREVSGTAEEVGEHVFATGTARLVVSADALPDAPVTVRLWQVRETRENTMVATLDARHRSCIFTNLPPQTLYAVTVDGAPDVQLTVRSRLTFREAFSLMLQELLSRGRNRIEIAKAPPVFRRGFWGAAKRKESDQYFCSGAYFSCSASSRSRSDSMRLWRARICSWVCICGTLYMWFSSTALNRYGPTKAGFMPLTVMLLSNRRR